MDGSATDSAETEQLLKRVEAGDSKALEHLFSRHRPYLRQVIEVRLDPKLRPRVDASDVVQETQLEAARRIGSYLERRPMPFRLWLRKSAYERLLDVRRRHVGSARRTTNREVPIPEHTSMFIAQKVLGFAPTPSQDAANQELHLKVRLALAKLPEMDREILLMRSVEGLSYAQIALVLEIAEGAARKRQGRALLRLHKILGESGLTESQA